MQSRWPWPFNAAREMREALSVVLGGCALALAALFAVGELVREDEGVWAVPLVALILWREHVFAGMRMELDRFRKQKSPT